MTKILVLYYSMYGHVETMAGAIAEGARSLKGVDVTVKRVPETLSPESAMRNGVKLDQAAPVATPGSSSSAALAVASSAGRPPRCSPILMRSPPPLRNNISGSFGSWKASMYHECNNCVLRSIARLIAFG